MYFHLRGLFQSLTVLRTFSVKVYYIYGRIFKNSDTLEGPSITKQSYKKMIFFVTFFLSFFLFFLLPNSHPPQRVFYHEKMREKETPISKAIKFWRAR